jgi:ketohexokinase
VYEVLWSCWSNSHFDSTIGAGDTFAAGMLYPCLVHDDDWSLAEKLEFSNELAGRKVMQEGFTGLGKLMKDRL